MKFYSARHLYKKLGYSKFSNFQNLIRRAQNLIKNATEKGTIEEFYIPKEGGMGTVQWIIDYKIDENAKELITRMSASLKMNNTYRKRNETTLIQLIVKYFKAKGYSCFFQKHMENFIFDLMIEQHLVIEFDEPYHDEKKIKEKDKSKNLFCRKKGIKIIRFTCDDDIIDMILRIEKYLDFSFTKVC